MKHGTAVDCWTFAHSLIVHCTGCVMNRGYPPLSPRQCNSISACKILHAKFDYAFPVGRIVSGTPAKYSGVYIRAPSVGNFLGCLARPLGNKINKTRIRAFALYTALGIGAKRASCVWGLPWRRKKKREWRDRWLKKLMLILCTLFKRIFGKVGGGRGVTALSCPEKHTHTSRLPNLA